ncbi:hypothetical protein [Hydrogenophaga defluvii]|uniref:Tail protein n=1 Tax=Hydrogenophaga defluvii TaxID=249410 RepID=A0ABW2S7D9_9BURK
MSDFLFAQPGLATGDLLFALDEIHNDPTLAGNLTFRDVAPATGHLLFGGELDAGSSTAVLRIDGGFAPITVSARLMLRLDVRLTGRFDPLAAAVSMQYRSNTARPQVAKTQAVWDVAATVLFGSTAGQRDGIARPDGWQGSWVPGQACSASVEHLLPEVFRSGYQGWISGFQQGFARQWSVGLGQQEASRVIRREIRPAFARASLDRHSTRFAHHDGQRGRRCLLHLKWQEAGPVVRGLLGDFDKAAAFFGVFRGRFAAAVRPAPGVSLPDWVVPPPGLQPCYVPSAHLLFAGLSPADGYLLFACDNPNNPPPPDGDPVVVPVRRVYFVINNVTLHRLPDGLPVPVFSLSLSLDAASWTWGFDALLPAAAEALVAPGGNGGPVDLVASVNGTPFRVLAESISRERVFADASIRISGRGRNAVLAAPYAPVMNFQQSQARTARQLMDDVLTLDGIPLGWNIDWDLTDWNVPAGVFTQQGTWMEALVAIASAAGGYLIPHASDKSIRVRHRYPTAPWGWNTVTPDFVLPVDAVARESLRWVEKPGYNRVFVSGQDAGVLGQVTRAGTAGDVLAPMVVDALITEAAAARQRGISVLADIGKQIEVSLRLPVLAETGIIEPGAFVEYQDGSQGSTIRRLGIVRSTQVEAGMPEVWQTLGVQSHA